MLNSEEDYKEMVGDEIVFATSFDVAKSNGTPISLRSVETMMTRMRSLQF